MPKITLIAAYAARRCIGITTPCLGICPRILPFSNPTPSANPSLWAAKHGSRCRANRCPAVKTSSSPARLSGRRRANGGFFGRCAGFVSGVEEVIIMGGAQIYAQALPIATDLRLTEVGLDVDGDAFFPEFSTETWQEASGKTMFPPKA